MKPLALFTSIFLLLIITSCDSNDETDPLLGTWKASSEQVFTNDELVYEFSEEEIGIFTLVFNADNTMIWTEGENQKTGSYSRENSELIINLMESDNTMNFEYLFENNNLVISFSYTESSGETTVVRITFLRI